MVKEIIAKKAAIVDEVADKFKNSVSNVVVDYRGCHRTLMIGDSLTSDIQGGNNANIDTVWFNPQHLKNSSSAQPTYEIDDLLQIKKLI